jgi:hypothetical protein
VNELNIEKPKRVLSVVALTALMLTAIVLISNFWPKYEMQFMELGLLGKEKMASNYFSEDKNIVSLGDQINWYIYVHNHMGSSQIVIIKVKLLNSTMEVPNDRENEPSSSIPVAEFPLSLSNNETLMVPFSWKITEAVLQNASVSLRELNVNEQMIDVNVSDFSNSFFRIVFELWIQDQVSGDYKFGWSSAEGVSSASVYMAFRLNSITTS